MTRPDIEQRPVHERLRAHLPVSITAAVVSTGFAAGPTVATAAFDAVNADKVDGTHAVGAGASAQQRAGKLVATSGKGRLPNDIIRKAPNADRLDGRDGGAYGLDPQSGHGLLRAERRWRLARRQLRHGRHALPHRSGGWVSQPDGAASLNANDSTSFIDALIREGSTTVWSTHWEPGDDDGWYDQQQTLTTVVPVQKGKHTYALQLREQSAANLARSTGTLGWWRSSSRRGPSSEPTWQRADARGIANLRHQILVCGT